MEHLFDIKCRNCGMPAGYDIVYQTYRCPGCGEESGIKEVTSQAEFRHIDRSSRAAHYPTSSVGACPNCGAEILYEAGRKAGPAHSAEDSSCGGNSNSPKIFRTI